MYMNTNKNTNVNVISKVWGIISTLFVYKVMFSYVMYRPNLDPCFLDADKCYGWLWAFTRMRVLFLRRLGRPLNFLFKFLPEYVYSYKKNDRRT